MANQPNNPNRSNEFSGNQQQKGRSEQQPSQNRDSEKGRMENKNPSDRSSSNKSGQY
jgi:hypothetical protein